MGEWSGEILQEWNILRWGLRCHRRLKVEKGIALRNNKYITLFDIKKKYIKHIFLDNLLVLYEQFGYNVLTGVLSRKMRMRLFTMS